MSALVLVKELENSACINSGSVPLPNVAPFTWITTSVSAVAPFASPVANEALHVIVSGVVVPGLFVSLSSVCGHDPVWGDLGD